MHITKIFLSIAVGITIFIGFIYGIAQAGSQSAPASPAATIRYVDADAPGPTHNGTSWASAFTNLQNALLVAGSGDEIWVAEGVYYPDKGIIQTEDDRTSSFKLKNNVTLYGGFDPQSGVDEFSERDWETYISVLSGDIDQNDTVDSNGVVVTTTHISGNNAYHVVDGNGTSDNAVLDGFTITAGRANGGEYSQTIGGGMVNLNDSDPTLRYVTFSGNLAAAGGGGMCNFNQSDPSLTDVVFSGNSASLGNGGGMCNLGNSNPMLTEVSFNENSAANKDGGGMYNHNSNPTLMQVSFTDNRATNGGGISNYQSSPTLTEVTFSNNAADEMGGGMANEDNSNPSLTNVTFSGNTAGGCGGMSNGLFSNPTLTNVTFSGNSARRGGGMCNHDGSSPEMRDVTFSNNMATAYDGGGMTNYGSNPTLTNVTFSGNSANRMGGGIYNQGNSGFTLMQASFTDNNASDGGGIYNEMSNITLIDVTFTKNSADHDGGGMYHDCGLSSLTNVIFSGNTASSNGGGMRHYSSASTLTAVEFTGNSADHGGGMYNSGEYPTLMQVSFTGNKAGNGGGLYNYYSSITLTNVIFSGNESSDDGGGIYNEKSSPSLANVTFVRNWAFSDGGGVYNENNSNPILTNTIFWLNWAQNSGNQIRNDNLSPASVPVISYSDIQGCGGSTSWNAACGTDLGSNIDSNPLFVRNPDPGPDGNWDGIDDDYGDLHLRFGSPAIDMGTNSSCPTSDLEGTPRPINAICDMGAYEYQNLAPIGVDDSGTGFSTDEDTPFTTDSVLTNDSDPNADVLILQSIDTSSTKGSVFDNGDGTFDYDPNGLFEHLAAGETATDSFTYTINDGHGGTDTATVTITIEGVNDAPSAGDDSGTGFSTDEDTPFTTANVLVNDSDPDGDTLSVQSIDTSSTKGTVADNGDGTFDYNPNGQFEHLATGEIATDSFTYTINDGHGGMDTATVMITITGMDDEALIYLPLVVR